MINTTTHDLGLDLDNLIDEYPNWGILDYKPACSDFDAGTPARLDPLYGFNGSPGGNGLASQGDITDWAGFKFAGAGGVGARLANLPQRRL
ncbi:MAG TPA: hypothetical protein VN709_00905 [Terriglobales bacterium]|nr:hypothetical protein [Terriglobales bacterium]